MVRPAPGTEAFLRAGDPASRLDADRRRRDLAALRAGAPIDVLVVGGGITGAGVALDAASRGLRVVLVERHDLAHGTSRWSSKLIHGGLRYLAKGDVAIAWESAVERAVIGGTVAPHLVRRITQVVPVFDGGGSLGLVMRAGLLGADAMRAAAGTERGLLARSRTVGPREARRIAPALSPDGLRGALTLTDLQLEDDARYVVAVARTAAAYGARILTRVEAAAVGADGVDLRDRTTGELLRVAPDRIVNAAGVWAGELDPQVGVAPSRGTHIVLRTAALHGTASSLSIPVPGKFGRFVFTLPQPDGLTYAGLTDEPVAGPLPEVPDAPDDDVAWILDVLNTALRTPLTQQDVVGRFAGLRPLLGGGDGGAASADLSRRHAVIEHGRTVTVIGGKFTTYRAMASDAVDRLTPRPCRTRDIALIGAGPRREAAGVPDRLWRRYGTEAPLVWSLGEARPQLRAPLAQGCPVLGVEAAFAIGWEAALSAGDVLHRRTRLGLVPPDAEAARPAVEDLFPGSAVG